MRTIRVFGAEWCPACQQQKSWMESKGIDFVYEDVDDPKVSHELADLGVRSLPFTIITSYKTKDYIQGFDPYTLMELIKDV